ncbi:endonuclease/exonuclease/phosphatase family protein [Mameliella alba]|nr:endonuclease/exonuclease/phosphatase family protein [Antarctobacter heliothermus]MBY6145574.1 endonuclease/exonuclease/phosphatase family protein [Mameliella alba]MCA0955582.1 endonuclease/exonuclease/phosphatase family protein [Mameliella alba]
MRHAAVLLMLMAALLAGCARPVSLPRPAPDALRVASHNVHFIRMTKARGPWSVADWHSRKHALDAVFKEAGADLIAFQEMVSIGPDENRDVNLARDWLLARNPGYGLAATGDWRSFPTRQPIFYRQDRLRLLDHGWFFYDAPEVVARDRQRRGFWLYYASWAEFSAPGQGQRAFRVYNVHFHFLDAAKRRHAARQLAAHVQPALAAGMPVLVLGDMNALAGWRTVRILRDAGLEIADPPGGSFHFNRGLHILPAIDRLGRAPNVTLLGGPWALRGQRAGDWPSDHYPVVADIAVP